MENDAQAKILQLLDVISVEVAANRNDTAELRRDVRSETTGLRKEMRAGFGRVERRLGNIETRVAHLESEVQAVKVDLRSFREHARPNAGYDGSAAFAQTSLATRVAETADGHPA